MEENAATPQNTLDKHIEALLFAAGGPMRITALAQALGTTEGAVRDGLETLRTRLRHGGLALVQTEDSVALTTNEITSPTIAAVRKASLEGDVGQAGLEVLAILLYRGPTARARIDYIRGVNSASTIRTLVARGLIERTKSRADAREVVYRPTTELLAHFGIERPSELPDYEEIQNTIATFEQTVNEQDESEQGASADAQKRSDV